MSHLGGSLTGVNVSKYVTKSTLAF